MTLLCRICNLHNEVVAVEARAHRSFAPAGDRRRPAQQTRRPWTYPHKNIILQ